MRRLALVIGMFTLLMVACGDSGRGGFDTAAELERGQKQGKAVAAYLDAHSQAPDSRFGKLARARAEILLLELGAQHLQAKQWDELDATAGKLLKLDGSSVAANIYKGCAAHGKGDDDQAQAFLEKASGEPVGVNPPSKAAVEATAEALFRGATAGAQSSLDGSVVDAQFLKNARTRLGNTLGRARLSAKRRAELLAENTLDAKATLLDNYPDSPEAAKVRPGYAKAIAAKLASVETVGPPTVDDPDPIATLQYALENRAPNEKVSKQALAKVDRLRTTWEETHEELLKTIDEAVVERRDKAIAKIATVIREKCAPLLTKANAGDESALEPLLAARNEAAKLIPNGLSQQEFEELRLSVAAACTPSKRRQ